MNNFKVGDIVSVDFIGEITAIEKSIVVPEGLMYQVETKKPWGSCRVSVAYITAVPTSENTSKNE